MTCAILGILWIDYARAASADSQKVGTGKGRGARVRWKPQSASHDLANAVRKARISSGVPTVMRTWVGQAGQMRPT